MAQEVMLTPTQAARQLGLSAKRMRQMARDGSLPCQVTPLGRLFPASAVNAMAGLRAVLSRPVDAQPVAPAVQEGNTRSQVAQEVSPGPSGTRTGAGRHAGHGASDPNLGTEIREEK